MAFLVGMVITLLVPGCHCDEGSGCSGCGLNSLVAFLLFGGFIGALFSLLFVLPASLLLAFVVNLFSGRKK